jgi:hypothetical protein
LGLVRRTFSRVGISGCRGGYAAMAKRKAAKKKKKAAKKGAKKR